MSCFPCFSSQKNKKNHNQKDNNHHHDTANEFEPKPTLNNAGNSRTQEPAPVENVVNVNVKTFTFRELATATNNFRQETLLGEGGYGRVYRGTLQATGQVVAVKQLDRNSLQGGVDFVKEVSSWGNLDHPNLVSFIGYCADGDQRLLVYEFIPGGSVEERLRDVRPDKVAMDWVTRMKIAHGAAEALEYLHEKANPPIIYRDLKSSNVLLGEDMTPKLSHFGLSKLSGDNMTMQSRVMGTYGYCAPEYNSSGQLTSKADVYSFGVILLELITGRKVLDTTKPVDEQNLVTWAQPLFRDPKNYPDMADPFLRKRFPERGINQAVAIAAMCLQDESAVRPLMSDLVTVLSFLSVGTEEKIPQTLPPAISSKLSLVIKDENFVERLSSVAAQDTYSSNSPTNNSEEDEEEEDYDSSSATSSRQISRRDNGTTVSPSQKRQGKNGKKSIGSVSRNSSRYSDCGSFSSNGRKSGKLAFSSSGRNSRKSHDSDYSEAERGEESSASLRRKSSRKSKGSKSSSRRSVEGCECSNSSKRRGRRRSSKKKGMQEGNVNSSS